MSGDLTRTPYFFELRFSKYIFFCFFINKFRGFKPFWQREELFSKASCPLPFFGKWKNSKRIGESGGEKLLKRLQSDYPNWQLNPEFVIQPVECMSACSRFCTIYFASPGKTTYLFADISSDLTLTEVNEVFDCAGKYYAHPEVSLPCSERPEPLKKGIIAKIPAISIPVEKNKIP